MPTAKQNPPASDSRKRTAKSGGARAAERREDERYEFHRGGVAVEIEHPGGGLTKMSAFLRNLSAGGLAFLSKSYVHPGSNCRINLVRKDGRSTLVQGKIRSCRYLQDSTHEVGVKFDSRIEPSSLMDVTGSDGRNIELQDLKGRILLADDSQMDLILFSHHLKGSGAEVCAVSTTEEALKRLGEENFDIVICNPQLDKEGTIGSAIAKVRAAGFVGPIVACTAETTPEKIAAATSAGAAHVLAKPYEVKELHDLLIMLHRQVGAVLTARAIYSTMDDNSFVDQGLAQFVTFARQSADQLQTALRANDVAAARLICLNLKGSSIGFGFASIGEAAREALEKLDATGTSMNSARHLIRYLGLMCKSAALRGNDG